MPVLQFASFASLVQPTFWHELTRLKLEVLRLSDDRIPVIATYSIGKTVRDRNTGQEIELGCNITVGGDAFDKPSLQPFTVPAPGVLKNFNTIDEFRDVDKKALFNQFADEMWEAVTKNNDASALNRFLVITFADLKKYRYHYWFAFPAFAAQPLWEIDGEWSSATTAFTSAQLSMLHDKLAEQTLPFFLIRRIGSRVEIAPVDEFGDFYADTPEDSRAVGFIDPSSHPSTPGWPLRNLLAYLRINHPSTTGYIQVLCWRDAEIPHGGSVWKSTFGVVVGGQTQGKPNAVGWEKNPQSKLGPRLADLAPMMDPSRLADQAVDLNLKLMRWRILPALDLEKIASTKCLLLGAGTLGCYVARTLMGWGVRTITLADSGRVSFSNPVRQPLFEFEDCLDGGKLKAECAASRLRKIFPGVNASGYTLSIPMPGHPVPPQSADQVKADVAKLEALIDEHDAVFLLMDSRESRWLPTVMGSAKGKIVMNAALGFDTFLVMRHGARMPSADGSRLGCYYCNDIVAPADSLTDRTLDQMCTVTRPGLASIASSTAVELLMSLIQHPDGIHAAPPPASKELDESDGGVLGAVPHQIRGYLRQFKNHPIVGSAFSKCTGCSETVLKEYEAKGFDMMLRAFNEPGYLEMLTGLDKLHQEGEEALEAVDWDEEDDF